MDTKNRERGRFKPWLGAVAALAAAQLLDCNHGAPEAPAPREVTGEGAQALTDVEPEVQSAFNDAACYCEAYLVAPLGAASDPTPEWVGGASANACSGDPRLASYQGKYSLANRQAGKCLALGGDGLPVSPSRLPAARTAGADEWKSNGCANPTPLEAGGQTPSPGFCRADFNYCLGQQLRVKADSLARPPSSVDARAKILEEARHRFEMAGAEFATSLEQVDAACAPATGCYEYLGPKSAVEAQVYGISLSCHEVCSRQGEGGGGVEADIKYCPDPPCEIEPPEPECHEVCTPVPKPSTAANWCTGLATTKRNALLAQSPASHDHVVSVTSALTSNAAAFTCTLNFTYPGFRSDVAATARNRIDGRNDDTNAVEQDYGDAAAMRLADSISQAADLLDEEVADRTAVSDALPIDPTNAAAFPAQLWAAEGARTHAARALMGERAPRPGARPAPPRALHRDERPRRALELLETYRVPLPYQLCPAPGAWENLDAAGANAWAAEAFAALGQRLAEQIGRPAAEGAALLQSEHALDVTHVRAALDLARDRFEQLDADHSFAPPEGSPPGTCGRGALVSGARVASQRDPLVLAAAFADGALAPQQPGEPAPVECSLSGARPAARALELAGGARAIDYVRAKAQALSRRSGVRPWGAHPDVVTALRETESFVGKAWTEWENCPFGAFCPPPTPTTWTLWNDAAAPTTVVVARSEAELSCLRRGHLPGAPAGSGCPARPEITLTPVTRDGIQGRSFTLDPAAFGPNDRAFVVGRACAPGNPSACTHRLLDVFTPALARGRHAFGGKLLDGLVRVEAHDTANPAFAAFNSLGLSNAYVPSLKNGIDGNPTTEAYAHYVQRALEAATTVAGKLEQAKQIEIDTLIAHNATQLHLDSAKIAQCDVLADACGASVEACKNATTPPTCAVARAPAKTLLELGVVPNAGPEPAGFGAFPTCSAFLTRASFQMPDDDIKDYIGGFVGAALRCTRWATLLVAGQAKFEGLPQRVVDELASTNPNAGAFTDQGGEVRELFIELYQSLRDVRTKTRAFDTNYRVAEARLQAALLLIDESDPSWWEKWTCRIGQGLKVAGAIAATVGGIAAVTAVTGPGGAAFVLADLASIGTALTSAGSGVEMLASFDECSDNSGAQAGAFNAWAQALESMETMRGLADDSARLIGTTALADNRLDKVEADAKLAAERFVLEGRIAANNALFDPAARAMQGQRLEEVRRLLRRAQYLTFKARRAVEFRTASELRWENQTAFLGGVPSEWANDLFTINHAHLTPASSLGSAGTRISAYANALSDFVEEYRETHEYDEGTDRTVLNLRGIVGTQGPVTDVLLFKCQGHPDLLLGGRLPGAPAGGAPCASLGGVESAQVTFAMPSNLSGYFAGRFATGNKNYRLDRVAVNLWGAGLFDCQPGSPPDCVTDRTLRYDLRQDGLVMLESLEGDRRYYGLQDGFVSQARALANEAVLNDPPDADDAAITQYERTELKARPMMGMYTLTLKSRPEVVWQSLEDVQFLLHYEYWSTPNLAAPRRPCPEALTPARVAPGVGPTDAGGHARGRRFGPRPSRPTLAPRPLPPRAAPPREPARPLARSRGALSRRAPAAGPASARRR